MRAISGGKIAQERQDELNIIEAIGKSIDDSGEIQREANELTARRVQENKNIEDSIKRATPFLLEQGVTQEQITKATEDGRAERAKALGIELQILEAQQKQQRTLSAINDLNSGRTDMLELQANGEALRGGRDSLTRRERLELKFRQEDVIKGTPPNS